MSKSFGRPMTTIQRIVHRMPQPNAAWAVVVALAGSLALLCLFDVAWTFAVPRIGRTFPEMAWRYGTPEMQRYAAQVLAKDIKPGMTFNQVLDILGPGSAHWPAVKHRDLKQDGIVGFNVRSHYNNGIDVSFQNGRVVNVFYYD